MNETDIGALVWFCVALVVCVITLVVVVFDVLQGGSENERHSGSDRKMHSLVRSEDGNSPPLRRPGDSIPH